jgi:D-threo-aldose 1-dehydrogenase
MPTIPWMRPLARTDHDVSAITFGTSPLGNLDPQAADGLVAAVLASDIRTIDTSNGYAEGRSEPTLGRAVAAAGGLPADGLIITKTDADGRDYSGDRVRRSIDESRERLGLDRLPLVHLHDPEYFEWDEITQPGGAVDALIELRARGVVESIGVAGGDVRVMHRYVELGVFDALLIHNRLTILDRSADAMVDDAVARGMTVFNAAVFGGGILAAPRAGITSYGYRPARPEILSAVAAMADVADEYGTSLATIALQASLREERVTSTVVGLGKPERVASTLAAAAAPLPDELFTRIHALLPPASSWLDA